jgi:predicted Zn finger-like uncharacterized protein
MNVACPSCATVFRVDPARIPAAGVRARCSRCQSAFQLTPRGAVAIAQPAHQAAASAPAPAPPQGPPAGFPFAATDPATRARRMARALVSDIVAYHGQRRDRSLQAGTLRTEFRDEIMRSWEEYVEQVGVQMARGTPYFRDALNEILAGGQAVF